MSLRQQARILGIAPSYLSMMVNGKRPCNPDIKERYEALVNSVVNTFPNQIAPQLECEKSNYLALAGARGSRTHHTSRRTAANGFEVRGNHRASSAPMFVQIKLLKVFIVFSSLKSLGHCTGISCFIAS